MPLPVEMLMTSSQQEPDGRWIPARPMIEPFVIRLRDAWRVLRGEAEAVTWPSQETERGR